MSIFSWIEKTRQKPPAERRRIAISIAMSVSLAIGIVWLIGFLIHVGSLVQHSVVEQAPSNTSPRNSSNQGITPPFSN